ncbi:hypothetical protein GCM10027261_25150 [Geodermatophilus arenarius]
MNGPAPVEKDVRPPPTCTRAALGPMLVRTPRLEARTRTPGASLTEKLSPMSHLSSSVDRSVPDAITGTGRNRAGDDRVVTGWDGWDRSAGPQEARPQAAQELRVTPVRRAVGGAVGES